MFYSLLGRYVFFGRCHRFQQATRSRSRHQRSGAMRSQLRSAAAAVVFYLCSALLPHAAGAATPTAPLTLGQAIATAQANDPWVMGNAFRQQSLEAQGQVAGSLPDPIVRVGLANLPTDTFDFNQEAMTQMKLGVSQVFPRGDSRELGRRRLQLLGSEHPYMREDRQASVAVSITALWLDAFQTRETIRVIERDRSLFEHLVDVAQSSYSSTRGRTRQQDIIRAQLELTRLEDRLSLLHEQLATALSQLAQWLLPAGQYSGESPGTWQVNTPDWPPVLAASLPRIPLAIASLDSASKPAELARLLHRHPALAGLATRVDAGKTGIELAEQQYKPQWRVDASYGYRDDEPNGRDRADFFSVGVAVDMPLFTSSRQDQQVRRAKASTAAARTDHTLALRKMVGELASRLVRLHRLDERQVLYRTRLLREMHEQAEAALSAYTSDDGDFAEVVRARIDELNASIDGLNIDIERLKVISQINYFLVESSARASGESS